MRKNLLLFVLGTFMLSFICSCATNTSGIRAKGKGTGCNTKAGMAKKRNFDSIQYR